MPLFPARVTDASGEAGRERIGRTRGVSVFTQ